MPAPTTRTSKCSVVLADDCARTVAVSGMNVPFVAEVGGASPHYQGQCPQRSTCGPTFSTCEPASRHPDRSLATRGVAEDLFCCRIDKKGPSTMPPCGRLRSG